MLKLSLDRTPSLSQPTVARCTTCTKRIVGTVFTHNKLTFCCHEHIMQHLIQGDRDGLREAL